MRKQSRNPYDNKDSSFLMLLRFYLICFLPKKACNSLRNQYFQRGRCFRNCLLSVFMIMIPSVQTASFCHRNQNPFARTDVFRTHLVLISEFFQPYVRFSPSALYSAAMSHGYRRNESEQFIVDFSVFCVYRPIAMVPMPVISTTVSRIKNSFLLF